MSGDAPAVVFLYTRRNRYGLHALAGSLEAAGLADPPALHFPRRGDELQRALPGLVARHRRLLVAFSFPTAEAVSAARCAARVRGVAGDAALLVAGGPHASGDPGGTLALGFDAAAVGEGEETVRDLVAAWLQGRRLEGIPGLVVPSAGGGASPGAARPPLELDRYPSFAAGHHKFGPIEITRGCPFGCPFCQTGSLFGRRPRHRGLGSILRHAEVMARNGIRDVRFISPNAFSWGGDGTRAAPERLEELLREVRRTLPAGGRVFLGSFPSEVRPESVTEETVAVVRRHAANRILVLGAQSGSPAMLERLGRGHGVEDVRRAVRLARAAGLTPYVDLIFGMPGETPTEARHSIGFARELASAGAVIHAHPFVPLPGSAWAGEPALPLSPEVCRLLSELAARGALHGDWRRKEREALAAVPGARGEGEGRG